MMYVSSAHSSIWLPVVTAWKSDAATTKEAGAAAEPCMMLAKLDTSEPNLVL